MVVVEAGVWFERDDLWPGGHDALNTCGDGFFCSGECANGVHTEVILCVARAGTVDECGAPGNGGSKRSTIEDVKSVLPMR